MYNSSDVKVMMSERSELEEDKFDIIKEIKDDFIDTFKDFNDKLLDIQLKYDKWENPKS